MPLTLKPALPGAGFLSWFWLCRDGWFSSLSFKLPVLLRDLRDTAASGHCIQIWGAESIITSTLTQWKPISLIKFISLNSVRGALTNVYRSNQTVPVFKEFINHVTFADKPKLQVFSGNTIKIMFHKAKQTWV